MVVVLGGVIKLWGIVFRWCVMICREFRESMKEECQIKNHLCLHLRDITLQDTISLILPLLYVPPSNP